MAVAQPKQEKKIYTIDDIARELGISKTTVSRAISGKGRLSAETRAKVLDFIEKHNYRPNAVAKSLAQSRTNNIGLILPGEKALIDYSFFQECTQGICQIASENDYDVLFIMDDDHSSAQVQRILDNRKVDGIIASRSEVNSPIISLLKDQHLPFAIIGPPMDKDVLCVDNNNREACRDLVSLLISRGIRRMALFGGNENHYVTHSRLQGFQDACRQANLPEQLTVLNLATGNRVAAAVEQAVTQETECIICMDNFICNLTLLQLRAKGISVPQDLKLACMYDSILLAHTAPPVTSLRFDSVEVGRAVCHELLQLLNGREANSYILPGYQLLLRDSTK
ncbi:MAG: LacI family transcriptional regulator [Oscillospiraceae bacterium]|nr:LacI family transcriptional regulator [Oscillospiraceae bacterium]